MGTLKDLPKDLKEKKQRDLAEDIVKYQNFKDTIACQKIRGDLSKSTKINYMTCARHYIKTGERYKNIVSKKFYDYIQECLNNHIQPLTPKFDERRRTIKKKYTKKEAKLSITKIVPTKISTKIEYGIKIQDKIILEMNEDRARAFLKGVQFLNPDTMGKIVAVELTEIE